LLNFTDFANAVAGTNDRLCLIFGPRLAEVLMPCLQEFNP
jgi:hypothetical protein